MMRKLFLRLFGTNADPERFLNELTAARSGRYNRSDRYRDFRQVFMGHSSPEQGQRVLAELFKLGGMYQGSYDGVDPNGTFVRAGKRDLCIRIMAIMNADPEKEENG